MRFGKLFAFGISFFVGLYCLATPAHAASNSFVTIVSPIRGAEFWQTKNQEPVTAMQASYEYIAQKRLPSTWLLRFDALNDQKIVALAKTFDGRQELGGFLEVTPSLAQAAGVTYNKSDSWHYLQSVLVIGYAPQDRQKLIDAYVAKFESTFGTKPVSVGAWWLDADSLTYMQEKYGITGALIVADQYSTDNYQIWGQYWSSPYYPASYNALQPAKDVSQKIPVVITQWAARDPYNAYGNGVYESTFSVQANDYIPFHTLGIDYFSKLVDIYTKPINGQFGQLTIGIENDYPLTEFGQPFRDQIDLIDQKARQGQFSVVSQKDFSAWYKLTYPDISPQRVISADDPLGSGGKVAWYMNKNYRVGWFFIPGKGTVIRDLRPYVDGKKEPCLAEACTSLNFATGATRVLDEVTFGINAVLTTGNITDFTQALVPAEYTIGYKAASGKQENLRFAQNDLYIDDRGKTIDSFILEVEQEFANRPKIQPVTGTPQNNWPLFALSVVKFLLAIVFLLYLPARILTRKALAHLSQLEQAVITTTVGIVLVTVVVFIAGYLRMAAFAPWILVILGAAAFIGEHKKTLATKSFWRSQIDSIKPKQVWPVAALVGVGTIVQVLPVIKSGLQNMYGLAFYGPNGHDAIWHLALIEQLRRNVPPDNPIFAGTALNNYHYFYDLFTAILGRTTAVSSLDIYFRLLPILLSILFGLLIYVLVKRLTALPLAPYLAVLFAYCTGSFGYIVSYLKGQGLFSGESAFWANQAISFHLNEPFAISIVILLAFLLLLRLYSPQRLYIVLMVLLAGTVIEFKVYAGALLLAALVTAALYDALFWRRLSLLVVAGLSIMTSLAVFLPNNRGATDLIIFSPFWLVHDMVNAPDRVGWQKLADARVAYYDRQQWVKYLGTEILGLGLFWLGNLGVRIIGLVGGLVIIFQKLRKRTLTSFDVFMVVFVGLSMVVPLLFIQKATAWNTIQFFYYGLFILSISTGITVAAIAQKFRNRIVSAILIVVIFVLAIATTIGTLKDYVANRPPTSVSFGEIAALNALASQPYGVVLTYPFDERLRSNFDPPVPLFSYTSTAYVSALTGKPVFLEDEGNNDIIGVTYGSRLAAEKEFFQGRDSTFSKNFLRNNNISYIYLPRYLEDHLDEGTYDIKKIYESDTVNIYRVD